MRLEEGLQEKTSGHVYLQRGTFNPPAAPWANLEAAVGLSKLERRCRRDLGESIGVSPAPLINTLCKQV